MTQHQAAQAIPPHIWTRLIRDIEITPAYRFVALVLAAYADSEGRNVRPTQAKLVGLTGQSAKTVQNALARLQALGLLHLNHRPTGPGDAAVYHLVLPLDLPEQRRRNGSSASTTRQHHLKLVVPAETQSFGRSATTS